MYINPTFEKNRSNRSGFSVFYTPISYQRAERGEGKCGKIDGHDVEKLTRCVKIDTKTLHFVNFCT
jgi:hypothetical protein